jgi:hypothetical protein
MMLPFFADRRRLKLIAALLVPKQLTISLRLTRKP